MLILGDAFFKENMKLWIKIYDYEGGADIGVSNFENRSGMFFSFGMLTFLISWDGERYGTRIERMLKRMNEIVY